MPFGHTRQLMHRYCLTTIRAACILCVLNAKYKIIRTYIHIYNAQLDFVLIPYEDLLVLISQIHADSTQQKTMSIPESLRITNSSKTAHRDARRD